MKNQLPDPQEAYDTLFSQVHERIFFHKLAAAGIVPRTRDEAVWMVETAYDLRRLGQNQNVKQANDESNPYYQMRAGLQTVLEQNGIYGQATDQTVNVKYAATALANDPTLYNAVLALKAHEAEAIKAQLTA
jgi:hypothetical protein